VVLFTVAFAMAADALADPAEATAIDFVASEAKAQGGVVAGEIRVGPTGEAVLVPAEIDAPPVPITPAPADVFVGVPIRAEVVAGEGTLKLEGIRLEALERWSEHPESSKRALPDAVQADLAAAYDALHAAAAAVNDFASRDETRALAAAYGRAEAAILDARDAVGNDDPAASEWIDRFGEIQAGKGVIEEDDRYPPETYRRIYERTRSAAALGRRGHDESFCSGVLIGADWLLTNLHCLRDHPIDQIVARFDYEESLDHEMLAETRYEIAEVVVSGERFKGRPDFAVLQLAPGPDGKRAGESRAPLCLARSTPGRGEALYLVGHPKGEPRTVHDHAYVRFPFSITAYQRRELRIALEQEVKHLANAKSLVSEFDASYRPRSVNGQTVYEYYASRWGKQPTIGVDADTFHGNSGSPALLRGTHALFGILFDGASDDTHDHWGWAVHEAVLPSSVIAAALDQTVAGWESATCKSR
jgi:hypothetical protein